MRTKPNLSIAPIPVPQKMEFSREIASANDGKAPQTSRLGFGTSGIMGSSMTASGRLRLLEMAFDQGVRHFDTAPHHGMGLAEEVIGAFVRGRRGDITITTTLGLSPPAIPTLLRPAMPIARSLNRCFSRQLGPQHQDRLNQVIRTLPVVGPSSPAPTYSTSEIRRSLEESLRKLATEYVDYLLLDHCDVSNLDGDIIPVLDALVGEGKIKAYGFASGRQTSRMVLTQFRDFRGGVQIPDHLLHLDTSWFVHRVKGPLFTHGVLRTPLRSPSYRPTLDLLLMRWAERLDEDPRQPELLSALLLTGALLNNPLGCVLVSTSQAQRLETYVQTLQRFSVGAPALKELLSDVSSIGSLPEHLAA